MKTKPCYYICGGMRGKKNYGFEEFAAACNHLRDKGYKVISPHEIDIVWGFDPTKSMKRQTVKMVDMVRRDVEAISLCDALITLPGWNKSVGARAEVAMAIWLKKPVYPLKKFI